MIFLTRLFVYLLAAKILSLAGKNIQASLICFRSLIRIFVLCRVCAQLLYKYFLCVMNRFIYIVLSLFLATGFLQAQNRNVARKHFLAGEYEVAKPMFESLLKRYPRNSEYSYWYAVCCYETKDTAADIKGLLEFAASRKISNAHRYLGDLYADSCNYVAAAEKYEEFLSVSTDDSLLAVYKAKLNFVNRLYRMIGTAEKVCVIDSFVVDKENFLSAYKVGRDVGSLSTVADFFDEEDEDGGFLSETERGSDIYYAMRNDAEGDTLLKLYHSSLVGEQWSKPAKLKGIDTGGNDNYPFMHTDGLTLYFASDGEGSIGEYDIFITRYDTENGRYLRPDNVGMPFNSTANDYMMVVNEMAGLGWFASDRLQPDGKVCVYVFIYNGDKERCDIEKDGYDKVLGLAQLRSIANTQNDKEEVRKARRQLAMLLYEVEDEKKQGDFLFVVDDALDYTSLSDFKNPQAKALFQKWQSACVQYEKDVKLLQEKRDAYAASVQAAQGRMRDEILRLEQKVDSDYYTLQQMEYEIRRLETDKIYKK